MRGSRGAGKGNSRGFTGGELRGGVGGNEVVCGHLNLVGQQQSMRFGNGWSQGVAIKSVKEVVPTPQPASAPSTLPPPPPPPRLLGRSLQPCPSQQQHQPWQNAARDRGSSAAAAAQGGGDGDPISHLLSKAPSWFILTPGVDGGLHQMGPFDRSTMQQLMSSGIVKPSTLVVGARAKDGGTVASAGTRVLMHAFFQRLQDVADRVWAGGRFDALTM